MSGRERRTPIRPRPGYGAPEETDKSKIAKKQQAEKKPKAEEKKPAKKTEPKAKEKK
jgi:hypothetical protein